MISILKRFKKKEILLVCISILFIVFQVWLDLKIPDYMSEITKLLQTEGTTIKEILVPGTSMIICAIGSLIGAVIVGYLVSNIAATFSKNLRKDIFRKVGNFGMEEIKNFSTSSLITRTTNDVTQVQMLIAMGLQMLIKSPIMVVWALTKMSSKAIQWTAVTGGAVLVLLLLITILIVFALPKFRIIQTLTDNLNRITRENLTGIRVVRAFNAEKFQTDRFETANNELTKTNMFTGRLMSLMQPVMTFIMSSLTLLIYFVGAYLIDEASMLDKLDLFSNMVVFSSYAMQVIISFMMLAIIFIIYPRASVSIKRINEVLKTKNSIVDGKKTTSKEQGTIEFKNVSFKYPDAEEYLLENINFKVNKGETIAFIGSTGSGKSSLINLIPRFYDVTHGEILVDGINVKEYKQEELYKKLGYIPQKAVMFMGSINYNVSYGSNCKKEEIKEAVRVAQGQDFVEKLSDTYETNIAQGGTNLSGGQKQRLGIARAIARNPEIYIFDDSFSALDYKTDYLLRKELKKYTKDATTLIVAQRIGTIKNADKIIVLDNGKVVGNGTHKQLLSDCEVYKEIALSQLSKEELENE
ncbi:MAG: ABC transporter ATP-binding protein [Bacilli bacterium]